MAKTVFFFFLDFFFFSLDSANPLTVTNFGGEHKKLPLFNPNTAWIKIAQKRLLEPTEHKMTKTVTLGSANPLTVTNLGGEHKKLPLFTSKTVTVKIVKKHFLQSAKHING